MEAFGYRKLLCILLLVLCTVPFPVFGQINIMIFSEEAKIYAEPDRQTDLYFTALKGDIFEAIDVRPNWTAINLFSGVVRYVESKHISYIQKLPPYPVEPDIRGSVCSEIDAAAERASNRARDYAKNDLDNRPTARHLFYDQYVLNIFRKYRIPASHYAVLIECMDDSLFPRNSVQVPDSL